MTRFRWLVLGLFSLIPLGFAWAQENYPDKPVRVIVPLVPGGMPDTYARILAAEMGKVWNQPVTVENRPGGGGGIGANFVAKSSGDGYTLLFTPDFVMVTTPTVTDAPYDPQKDFVPIMNVVSTPYVLIATPTLPANTVKDFTELANAQRGKLSYASAGTGTFHHLIMELLKSKAGIDIVHIPYKGMGQALPDVIAGRAQVVFSGIGPALPFIRSGKLKAIGVTSDRRVATLREVPTLSEAGYADLVVSSWVGFLAPAGTPHAIVQKVSFDVKSIVQTPQFKERLARDGLDLVANTPEEFKRQIDADINRWVPLIKKLGIKAN
jgi:tripartite-type tricarboxylate transporter receptor subunit TctC